MRVLRVIDSLNPSAGGPAVSALGSAISVARTGIRTDIATVVRPGEADSPWWRHAASRCETEGIGLEAFSVFAARLSPHHYDPSAELARWLVRRDRRRYDIVHAHSPWTGASAIAATIATMSASRLVLTPHAVFMSTDLSRGSLGIRVAKRVGVDLYGRASDLIVCSSSLEMLDAGSAGLPRKKLTWIYHPVIDERQPARAPTALTRGLNGLRIGFLGRLHAVKNIDILIDAAGRLDDRVSLVVAGRGDEALEDELRRRAERLLPGRVDFVGWVSGEEKREFLEGIDVLVMPSEYECFGVAAIEALAVGTPVIVSDRVGVADIIREGQAGRVVRPTVWGVAEAIRGYLDDRRSLAQDAGRSRNAALGHASYAAHGASLASMYRQLVAARQ